MENYVLHDYNSGELKTLVAGFVKKYSDKATIYRHDHEIISLAFESDTRELTSLAFRLLTLRLPALALSDHANGKTVALLDPTAGYELPEILAMMNLELKSCRIGFCSVDRELPRKFYIAPPAECTEMFLTGKYPAQSGEDTLNRPRIPEALLFAETREKKLGGVYEVSYFCVLPIGYRKVDGGQDEADRRVYAKEYQKIAMKKLGYADEKGRTEGTQGERGGATRIEWTEHTTGIHYEDDMALSRTYVITDGGRLVKPHSIDTKVRPSNMMGFENAKVDQWEIWDNVPKEWAVVSYVRVNFSNPPSYTFQQWPAKLTQEMSDRLIVLENVLAKDRADKMAAVQFLPMTAQWTSEAKTWSRQIQERLQERLKAREAKQSTTEEA